MTAPRFKFPLLLAVVAAGLAAVAIFSPLSSASDKPSEQADAVEARQDSLATLVAAQDAAARRAIETSRQLTASSDEATVASAKMAGAPAAGRELLRPVEDPAAAPAAGSKSPKVRTIRMLVTAYCPCTKCCGPNAQGITASGKRVSYNQGRFVAADKKVMPFGTKLIIPGYHEEISVEVTDTGSAIKGNRLDVYYPSHQRALEWGKQWLDVVVVE